MSYKCLFTVLTDVAVVQETLDHAVAAAMADDAHLDVLCLGVDRTQTGYFYAGASAIILQETIAQAHEDAKAIEAKVKACLEGVTLRWSSELGVVQLADISRFVATRARFSDLVLLPKPYGEGRGAEMEAVAEAVLFEGHAPAVILPESYAPTPKPKLIMIGWNDSVECLTAVRAAMPLLKQADQVRVVVIDPPKHAPNRSDPGGDLSQFLARHDVQVEVDVLSKTLPRVSEVLNRHAAERGADMVIMGAYGHSRFREAIFGGATRLMLENTTVPLLMAH